MKHIGVMSYRNYAGNILKRRWFSQFHELLGWYLSSTLLRRNCKKMVLVTDTPGKRLLIDRCHLDFDEVSIILDGTNDNWKFWGSGKLEAYRVQTEPFIHIDDDVFLWKPVPERIWQAKAFSQGKESTDLVQYPLEKIDKAVPWKPSAWPAKLPPPHGAGCLSICGGTDMEFFHDYTEQALKFAFCPENRQAWWDLREWWGTTVIEQFIYYAVAYQRGVEVEHLIDTEVQWGPEAEAQCEEIGFTHLWGAKRTKVIAEDLEAFVLTNMTDVYDRLHEISIQEFGKDYALIKAP